MDIFDKIKKTRKSIAVIGEFALDCYYQGEVSRISPEAPIVILKSNGQVEYRAGCAANVAQQFKHFNVDVSLYSVIDDETESCLKDLCFSLDNCIKIPDYKIPKKIRYYDGQHPLIRVDIESNIPKKCLDDLFNKIYKDIDKFQVIILSNYNKGIFASYYLTQRLIELCNKKGIISIVDPKIESDMWRGCTVFKPNSKEAQQMGGDDWRAQCYTIKKKTECENVVITQGGSGISLLDKEGLFQYKPIEITRDFSSLIGAGDSYTSILSLMLMHDVPIREACKYAFEGAAEYVKKKHNTPICPYELHKKLHHSGKIMTVEELMYLKNNVYKEDKFILTNGIFDIIHKSHVECLSFAKQHGNKLIVAMNSDASTKRLKGDKRPFNNLQDRMNLIAGLESVDFVVSFEEDTPIEVIKNIVPSAICKGSDWQDRINQIAGVDVVGKDNIIFFPYKEGYSTTRYFKELNI